MYCYFDYSKTLGNSVYHNHLEEKITYMPSILEGHKVNYLTVWCIFYQLYWWKSNSVPCSKPNCAFSSQNTL